MSPSLWEAVTNFCATWSRGDVGGARRALLPLRLVGESLRGSGRESRARTLRPARRGPQGCSAVTPRPPPTGPRGPGPGPQGALWGLARGWGAGGHEREAGSPGVYLKLGSRGWLALVYVNPETAGGGAPRGRAGGGGAGRSHVTRGRAAERRAQPSRGGDHRCPRPGT